MKEMVSVLVVLPARLFMKYMHCEAVVYDYITAKQCKTTKYILFIFQIKYGINCQFNFEVTENRYF